MKRILSVICGLVCLAAFIVASCFVSSDLASQVTDHEVRITELDQRVSEIEIGLADIRTVVNSLKLDSKEHGEKIGKLETDLQALRADLADLWRVSGEKNGKQDAMLDKIVCYLIWLFGPTDRLPVVEKEGV